jgi:hypothetical protein
MPLHESKRPLHVGATDALPPPRDPTLVVCDTPPRTRCRLLAAAAVDVAFFYYYQ